MPFENLVAISLKDKEAYEAYRKAMAPLLEEYGGSFPWDLRIEETLKSEGMDRADRVFLIRFPNRERYDGFFSDERYKKVRVEHFEPAVRQVIIAREFETSD